jgi:ClpP class serine protease
MTIEQQEIKHSPWSLSQVSLWILIPLVLGILISLLIPRPAVGVIYLSDAIYYYSAHDIIQQLTAARNSAEIRAVVIVMNSPGGTVTDTESVYREIIAIKTTEPVVTSLKVWLPAGDTTPPLPQINFRQGQLWNRHNWGNRNTTR